MPHSPTGRLYCTVGGDPLTMVMTLKTYLQRASLHHYSRKSSPIKSAERIHLILKSMFQVFSLINLHAVSKNRLYKYSIMESYKFHYLRKFHHFRLVSKPDTILVLCCKVCRGQGSNIIDFVNHQKCTC